MFKLSLFLFLLPKKIFSSNETKKSQILSYLFWIVSLIRHSNGTQNSGAKYQTLLSNIKNARPELKKYKSE